MAHECSFLALGLALVASEDDRVFVEAAVLSVVELVAFWVGGEVPEESMRWMRWRDSRSSMRF